MQTKTSIVLDNKLIAEARKYSNVKTKKGTIELALKEFIRLNGRKKLTNLKGKLQFKEDYDYKKMRTGSSDDNG